MHWVRVRSMKDSVGATPYGGDLNKIPARVVDAFVILQEEHNRVERMSVSRRNPTLDNKQRQGRR